MIPQPKIPEDTGSVIPTPKIPGAGTGAMVELLPVGKLLQVHPLRGGGDSGAHRKRVPGVGKKRHCEMRQLGMGVTVPERHSQPPRIRDFIPCSQIRDFIPCPRIRDFIPCSHPHFRYFPCLPFPSLSQPFCHYFGFIFKSFFSVLSSPH